MSVCNKELNQCNPPFNFTTPRYSEVHDSRAVFNWDFGTVRLARGKVLKSIFQRKNRYWFCCTLNLKKGDIVSMNNNKYRIKSNGIFTRLNPEKEYEIKRLDNLSISQIDLDNSNVGNTIYLSTPSAKTILKLYNNI